MTLSLGDVVLSDDDMPDTIPLGSKLNASQEVYSDGSQHLEVSGFSYNTIQLTGTLRYTERGQTPMQRMDRLRALHEAGAPVTFVWSGQTASRTFPVLIQEFTPVIVRNAQVDYTLLLFREVLGSLSSAASPTSAATTAQQTSTRLAVQATDGTTAAILLYQQAVDALHIKAGL